MISFQKAEASWFKVSNIYFYNIYKINGLFYRPENAKKLFNLRHASLRNVIKQIFGVLKQKYRVFSHLIEYSTQTQVLLVTALTVLYNFVRQHEGPNADYYLAKEVDISRVEEEKNTDLSVQSVFDSKNNNTSKAIEAFRNQIAEQMWKDYRQYQKSCI